ncbi:MAG: CinA family protein [Candidatus Izemoplasmatales bacterium]
MRDKIVEEISILAKDLIVKLSEKDLKISFAESVTGGLLSSSLTKEKNASKILSVSFVVYSNEAKEKTLNVKKDTLETKGVYSLEVVDEMLNGLKELSEANVLIAVSGIAGPDEVEGHKIGEIYLGIEVNEQRYLIKKVFSGTREMIQYMVCKFCFEEVLNII